MSMDSSSYDASTSVPESNHQATPTRSMTVTTATAQQSPSNSGSSGSSTSIGTIAGSGIGGIAGAAIIGADDMPHNVSQEAGANAFIAELPAPDDGKHC
ncbi:hypothetical protein AAEP93_002332 [Penicillium crustosum]